MGKGKVYEVIVTQPAKTRYQVQVLPYLYENFTFDRATEINEKILDFAATLDKNPDRGRNEDYLRASKELFKFILFKETRHFELKIIYYISEPNDAVYVTDFFPTKMNPQRIRDHH